MEIKQQDFAWKQLKNFYRWILITRLTTNQFCIVLEKLKITVNPIIAIKKRRWDKKYCCQILDRIKISNVIADRRTKLNKSFEYFHLKRIVEIKTIAKPVSIPTNLPEL